MATYNKVRKLGSLKDYKYNEETRSVCFQYNETDNSLNEANADYSFVIGYNNKAHKQGELQAGNTFVGGDNNNAYHSNSLVFGQGLYTETGNTTVLGKYNNTLDGSGWGGTIRMVVGGGYADDNRNNIMVLQDGGSGLHIRGGAKTADYIGDFGEYFEWNDGNLEGEDRIGYMVQLNEGKIELAENFDNCIGVISGTSSFVTGTCALDWHGRFLRDEWGRYLKNEDGQLIENPQYNKARSYQSREERPEWDIVGLVGQVLTRQDGTLKSGGFAGCKDGIATNSDKGYRVVKIINEKIALLLIK